MPLHLDAQDECRGVRECIPVQLTTPHTNIELGIRSYPVLTCRHGALARLPENIGNQGMRGSGKSTLARPFPGWGLTQAWVSLFDGEVRRLNPEYLSSYGSKK